MYEHDKGAYGTFYGINYSSYVTLMANPNPDYDKVMDNIMYIHDIYNETTGLEEFNKSFTSIRVWNPYQDSGEQNLTYGNNIRRKFREFGIILPRENRLRIRGPQNYIQMRFYRPDANYRYVLYDTDLWYTINQ